MSRGIKVTYELSFRPDFKQWPVKTIRKGMEKALAAVGTLWFREFLKKHFEASALKEYDYQKRESAYTKFKAIQSGGRPKPMVGIDRGSHRAGQLKREANSQGLVRATPKRVSIRFSVPGYAKRRSRGGAGPNLAEELTRLSKREVNRILDIAHKQLARALEKEPKRKRTKQ